MTDRERFKQLCRDIRVINRGNVYATTHGLKEGVINGAVDPDGIKPWYHDVDDCVRYLGSERDLDQRKRAASRIRFYLQRGVSFAERYAERLP